MKVILIKNVSNLGHVGEVKQVSDGFARNFLLPNKLARIATEISIKEMEAKKKQQAKSLESRSKKFKEIAKKINNIKIIVQAKASASAEVSADRDEKKTLFGSITTAKIAEELKKRKYEVDPKYIILEQPIKSLGYYDVVINFGSGVQAKIGLTVTREE